MVDKDESGHDPKLDDEIGDRQFCDLIGGKSNNGNACERRRGRDEKLASCQARLQDGPHPTPVAAVNGLADPRSIFCGKTGAMDHFSRAFRATGPFKRRLGVVGKEVAIHEKDVAWGAWKTDGKALST